MDKKSESSLGVVLAVMLLSVAVFADDIEVYEKVSSRPKVLFVLDTSGSMGVDDASANNRLSQTKSALATVMAGTRGIDVGLMSYNSDEIKLVHPVEDAETSQTTIQAAISSLVASGGTPTVAALLEAQRYLSGGAPYRGSEPAGLPRYVRPTTHQCETNHIVLLTDGRPTRDSEVVADLAPMIGSCAMITGDRGTCGAELASYMANADQFPDIPGNNNITLHFVGFNIDNRWFESLVAAGGGFYRNATSTEDLLEVFRGIINSLQLPASAAAPTVSINALNPRRHSDEIYYSFFQPGAFPRWEGNIKKYRLLNGVIVDANNRPIIDSGLLRPASTSLWSVNSSGMSVPDGATVHEGGMAARLPAGRTWYTEGSNTSTGRITPQQIISNTQIAPHWLNAGSDTERDTLVEWVRGFDSIDRDGDSIVTEPNNYVADTIHSSPVLITYQAQQSSGMLREVLYSMTNMGVLHATDPQNGDELWSYTPGELLPNIKGYVDNSSPDHIYGLDGTMVAAVENKASSPLDIDIEKAYLYLTQRRGGNHLFALDVSNPFSGSPIDRLWKIEGGIAGTDFRDLAQTWSTPAFIPVRYGCPAACDIKQVLLFGGGYNPVYDNKSIGFPVSRPAVGHGNAIYMVDPETGQLLWSAGNGTHHSLNLPVNDSVPDSPVAIDSDNDGAVNVIFFSDIAGNIWRVDLDQQADTASDMAIAGGKIASLNEPGQQLRFFNRPDVSINSFTNGTANFHLSIGSGMRSSPAYRESANNRLFVVKDPWVFDNPTRFNTAAGVSTPDYRYVSNSSGTHSVITPGELSSSGAPAKYGFYRELPAGEKVLQPTLTTAGRVFLTTYVPPDPGGPALCAYQTGESRLYIYDVGSGANKLPATYGPYVVVGSGITDSGKIVDTGASGGPDLLIGTTTAKLMDLLQPDARSNFRRFFRTGWSELND